MAKSLGKVAKRYASALFSNRSGAELEQLNAALSEFSKLWETDAELRGALLNPINPTTQRKAALKEISDQICPNQPSFSNFIALLLENRRLESVSQIAAVFNQLVEQFNGLLTLEVVSAFPLSHTESAEMEVKIAKALGRNATIKWQVDPDLIGGLVVKTGDRLLDGSVRNMLEQARDSLRL